MYTIPLQLIRIDQGGCHLMMHAGINEYKANVLIDTGASMTVMDLNRAQKYLNNPEINPFENYFTGMGEGKIETWTTHIPSLTIGSTCMKDLQILLIDMSPIQKTYACFDLPRIDIVLGGDLLMEMGAVIDYPNRKLMLTEEGRSKVVTK